MANVHRGYKSNPEFEQYIIERNDEVFTIPTPQ